MYKIIVLFAFMFLTACGGSGSGSSSNSQEDSSSNSNASAGESVAADTNLIPVSGLYNTSTDTDEVYLYISSTGDVIAYDYQGDAEGSGANCYSLSEDSAQINSGLNGGVITYSEADNKFTITKDDLTLSFDYDEVNGMSNFLYNNFLSSGSALTMSNPNIRIGGDAKLQTTAISIDDIESMTCS